MSKKRVGLMYYNCTFIFITDILDDDDARARRTDEYFYTPSIKIDHKTIQYRTYAAHIRKNASYASYYLMGLDNE